MLQLALHYEFLGILLIIILLLQAHAILKLPCELDQGFFQSKHLASAQLPCQSQIVHSHHRKFKQIYSFLQRAFVVRIMVLVVCLNKTLLQLLFHPQLVYRSIVLYDHRFTRIYVLDHKLDQVKEYLYQDNEEFRAHDHSN